ncbi:GTP 3',8-cyclase MoaA [Kocuria sp.]|uniref:GTP 3',8-cyclase MoaA n=1 Tax=Kocuria sp. TaxID=1871328 RepID=UPI0026DAE18D|nr:GTP 3',8-cyclase MoaA [Kocuria sp.]MDO4918666.1 GTP 3',8-cyclase MoaA [Kocuria sp.]
MPVFLGNPQVLPARGAPTQGPLTDRFGRTATDLRISLTDKCNLRCTYCMPAEGMQWLPRESLLSVAEIVRLARIAVTDFGVREVRLTGGEPLIRPDLEELVSELSTRLPGIPVSMTSNGIGLAARAQGLKDAGMTRVNISLDTLCAETYARLARRGRLGQALEGVAAAQRVGMSPVKLNAVLMRGVNDHEAPQLLRWSLENGCDLRFIEQMPLDADHGWTRENMVTAQDIRASLSQHFDITPDAAPRAGAPAEKYLVRERGEHRVLGTVGIIASVTEPFCEDCTRTRITAEGHVRSCLFSHHETDLMHLLRSGASDEDVAQRWRDAMWVKPRAHGMEHTGLDSGDYVQPDRSMSAIGG